jgi:hypothetical protein
MDEERRELDSIVWTATKAINDLVEHANDAFDSVRFTQKLDDELGGRLSPELLSEFYSLADKLIDVWLDHEQGDRLRGELTPSTFKDVLDRNVLLSETAPQQE